ncbi:MAG: GNAT family N-acetyltransferase [Stagnimonas sp.]|nr:GNAT family N-acetyltransferase [Stagnimonas sp.]
MSIRHLDALLRPDAVVCIGSASEAGTAQLVEQLRGSLGPRFHACDTALADWPQGAQRLLALIADPALASVELLARLGERGCQALLWPQAATPGRALLEQTRRSGLRLLGPRAGGVAHPALGLRATSFPCAPADGGLALIAQSQSIAAAALDWAAGRHLGFSWVAISGAEADVDVADLLDYAALDPRSQGVVLQLSSIRSGRKFMSAARACARLKPVVVLQSQPAARIGRGPDPVRSAAFARAGLVECESLPGLFDALAALQRLPALQQASALVIGNGAGICALGVDALARQGLTPLPLSAELRQRLPPFRDAGGALDFGSSSAAELVAVLRQLLADPALPAVLLLHSPGTGSAHLELAAPLAASPDPRLLTVWLGLATAQPARSLCAQAGLATFTSADGAARALRYRWEYHRRRELLTQTPPPLPLPPTAAAEQRLSLRELVTRGIRQLAPSELAPLLGAYGLAPAPAGASSRLRLSILSHPELGLHLELVCSERPPAYAYAPLDPLLAGRWLEQAGMPGGGSERPALSLALVQLAQLLVDQPELAGLQLSLDDNGGWLAAGAELWLTPTPPPERQRLVLAPYPMALSGRLEGRDGRGYQLRPVRADDEPALIALLGKLDPEEVRMRFFIYIRQFSHAMGARMSQIDYDREMSLVLVPEQGRAEEVVAIATLIADPDGRQAEFALLVHHDHARGGLGSRLLRRLLDHAWQQGIGQVHGTVLTENRPMLAAARRLGFRQRPEPDEPGCQRVEIDAPP